jgi:hypothetical protein
MPYLNLTVLVQICGQAYSSTVWAADFETQAGSSNFFLCNIGRNKQKICKLAFQSLRPCDIEWVVVEGVGWGGGKEEGLWQKVGQWECDMGMVGDRKAQGVRR